MRDEKKVLSFELIPYSLFPTPYSLLPIPHSLFPIPTHTEKLPNPSPLNSQGNNGAFAKRL
jgi:hypothetical protein